MTSLQFSGQYALVTGAGSGIGREVALALAAAGAQLVLAGRHGADLERTGAVLDPTGRRWRVVPCDIADEASVQHLLTKALQGAGRLDIAVNAAGVFATGALDDTSLAAFRALLDTNTLGTWLCMKHEVKAMKRQGGGGAIVNIASNIGPHLIRPGVGAYAASKAAVAVLTRTAALEAVGQGIRINCVSPGPTDSAMSYRPGEDRAARDARVAASNPSGRVATLQEMAAAVLWLCSPDAAYTVGHDLVVDGGASV